MDYLVSLCYEIYIQFLIPSIVILALSFIKSLTQSIWERSIEAHLAHIYIKSKNKMKGSYINI
jgi:hypothetical protein